MVRGTVEHDIDFTYLIDTLNVDSSHCIMVKGATYRFIYYFLIFGACIRGFVAHMIKVNALDDTLLHDK